MAEEVELPVELSKLEITPILPQIKILDSNLPLRLNPFFENDNKPTDDNVTAENISPAKEIQLIYPRPSSNCRRCRYRRASESIIDELKYDTAATDFPECNRTPPSGILKQPLKKIAISPGNRKALLREPILKASRSTGKTNSPLATKGMSDFRKLIDECRSLLTEEADFTGKLNQLCLSSRNSKNFTTIQTPKITTGNSNKPRCNKKQIFKTTSQTKLSQSSIPLLEQQYQAHPNGMPLIQPSLLGNRVHTTSMLQRNINSLSPEHPRCSTTCSQQAGNSAAAASTSDDVTIDELASYFDTFVHIPKKMSSMAEMMYI